MMMMTLVEATPVDYPEEGPLQAVVVPQIFFEDFDDLQDQQMQALNRVGDLGWSNRDYSEALTLTGETVRITSTTIPVFDVEKA